jgi:PIN domain nuclease of toxin-antitoxin system
VAGDVIVLDTHALLWWALDPDKLSPAAVTCLADVERRGGFASAISIWELGIKIQRGKLELGMSIDEFASRLARTQVVELVAVDTRIWLRSLELPWDHRDTADRVIVATAAVRGLPLLTADAEIHRFAGVTCIW